MAKLEAMYTQHIAAAELQDGEVWSDTPAYNEAMNCYMESIVSHLTDVANTLRLDELEDLTDIQLAVKYAPARARYFYSQWPQKPRALPPPTESCVKELADSVLEYPQSWTEVSIFLYKL